MTLSIIIINYNVKYFLEQCLYSVSAAMEQLNASFGVGSCEVIVIDNHSSDGSVEYLEPRFSFVKFVANRQNTGFASANNQAWKMASGRYILFLNPDTIVAEDSLRCCVEFMLGHPDAGAVGVRMIDGGGTYLKESKRGFPSPWVSFCKMSGLTKLFPHSKTFAHYYLGHLSDDTTRPVEALAGAFMLCTHDILNKTGGFDERFFMYAEDIDLSYRIQKAGFKNYYFAGTTIIHFKGESTRKDIRYVKYFYKAMSQFVKKHYRGIARLPVVAMLQAGIWLRASVAAIFHAPGKNKNPEGELPGNFIFEGDTESINEVANVLTSARKSEYHSSAGRIIYCQGSQFPFARIIELVAEQPSPSMIHAWKSGSIIGSSSARKRGEVIVLD